MLAVVSARSRLGCDSPVLTVQHFHLSQLCQWFVRPRASRLHALNADLRPLKRPSAGLYQALLAFAFALATACGGTEGAPASDSAPGSCAFSLDAQVSEVISTVGIVTWSSGLDRVESAHIDFGLDESYGLTAPVELSGAPYRTLLLGMKAEHTYHARIVAEGSGRTCTSDDFTLTTGSLPNGLPKFTRSRDAEAELTPGYLVSCFLTQGPAFVLDADGDYVWWYGSGEMGRATLSYDGKELWYASVNVAGDRPSMKRVSLDGLVADDLSDAFGNLHHDFVVLPDETITFIQHDGEHDVIIERAADGSQRVVAELANIEDSRLNHTNSIHYSVAEDAYTLSDLATNAIVMLTRAGERRWVLGGKDSDFSGDGSVWEGQHGHELIGDHLLFFNNGPPGGESSALEVALDFEQGTATRVWQYTADLRTLIYGDVQRLENGHTLVTFSTSGELREVDAAGHVVQSLTFGLGGAVGYATHRLSLYGPPD